MVSSTHMALLTQTPGEFVPFSGLLSTQVREVPMAAYIHKDIVS